MEGSTLPSPCPVGYVSPLADRMSLNDCSPCPSGFFCNSSALTEPSGPCSPGLPAHNQLVIKLSKTEASALWAQVGVVTIV